jgi:hypothetical protein
MDGVRLYRRRHRMETAARRQLDEAVNRAMATLVITTARI